MRRLARRLLAILTALSFLLCLATAVLWVRSYWRGDWLMHMTGDWEMWNVGSGGGRISILCQSVDAGPSSSYWSYRSTRGGHFAFFVPQWRHAGFSGCQSSGTIADTVGNTYPYQTCGFAGPHGVICLLLSILPCIAAARHLRRRAARRRAARHQCQRCSYNLTGNVSGVCPECGTGIPSDSVR